MAKKIKTIVKIMAEAGKATPASSLGPTLAQQGVNIGEFCKKFNDETKDKTGLVIPAEVTIYEDRSYSLKLKTPLTSQLIKKAIGIEKGSGEPNKKKVGKISKAQLEEIAKIKMEDLNTTDVKQAVKVIAGTAKNMGVEIKE